MKIAVLKIGAFGDVLMSTPFLASLKKGFPSARIDYWLGSSFACILDNFPGINVIAFDERIFYRKHFWKLPGLIYRLRKERYDLIFVLDRHWVFGLVGWLGGIPKRIGFDRNGEGVFHSVKVHYGSRIHEIKQYVALARAVGCPRSDEKMRLYLSAKELQAGREIAYKYRIMGATAIAAGGAKNPGQDMASRRWPVERFALVAKEVAKSSKVVLVGGRDDVSYAEYISRNSKVVNLVGKYSLRDAAAVLKHCKVLITNDSGLMHIASAVGCCVAAIFGPTDPVRKAPPGSFYVWNAMVLDKEETFAVYSDEAKKNINKVSVEDVVEMWRKACRA